MPERLDAGNVTIFGQSSGGGKVSTLLAMPAAEGLIHKAIVQSGSFGIPISTADATEWARRVYRQLKIKVGNVSALRRLPASRLLACYEAVMKAPDARELGTFSPVGDGQTLPADAWNPRAPESQRNIPMIIGTTSQETVAMMDTAIRTPIPDDDALVARIRSNTPHLSELFSDSKVSELIALYRRDSPGMTNTELLVKISTDNTFWRAAIAQIERKVTLGGAPAYMYEFAWKTPCFGGQWALHGVELPFVFGIPDYGAAWDGTDSAELRAKADPDNDRYRLTDLTVSAWANFAHTGNPSTRNLPWPAYNLERRPVMVFDHQYRLVEDLHGVIRAATT